MMLAAAAAITAPKLQAQITNVDQLYGDYHAVYAWGLYEQSGRPAAAPNFLITPTISAGDAENEILINGLFPTNGDNFPQSANLPIKATVDLQKQTVTVAANQVLGQDGSGQNYLYLAYVDVEADDVVEVNNAVANITPKGDISFPTEYVIACVSSSGGFWYVYYTLTLQPYNGEYTHPASFFNGNYTANYEWVNEDENPISNPHMGTYPVITANEENVYQLEITGLYPAIQKTLNITGEVMPSGDIKIDNIQNWDLDATGKAYQLVIFDINTYGMPDYMLVTYDEEGNLIFPENYVVSMQTYSGPQYTFTGMYPYLNLSFTKWGAGVESLGVDENAPVKYFDLNGRVLKNPAKGQLFIKKQGDKATKMIAR